jgi:hypothetical protein
MGPIVRMESPGHWVVFDREEHEGVVVEIRREGYFPTKEEACSACGGAEPEPEPAATPDDTPLFGR